MFYSRFDVFDRFGAMDRAVLLRLKTVVEWSFFCELRKNCASHNRRRLFIFSSAGVFSPLIEKMGLFDVFLHPKKKVAAAHL